MDSRPGIWHLDVCGGSRCWLASQRWARTHTGHMKSSSMLTQKPQELKNRWMFYYLGILIICFSIKVGIKQHFFILISKINANTVLIYFLSSVKFLMCIDYPLGCFLTGGRHFLSFIDRSLHLAPWTCSSHDLASPVGLYCASHFEEKTLSDLPMTRLQFLLLWLSPLLCVAHRVTQRWLLCSSSSWNCSGWCPLSGLHAWRLSSLFGVRTLV